MCLVCFTWSLLGCVDFVSFMFVWWVVWCSLLLWFTVGFCYCLCWFCGIRFSYGDWLIVLCTLTRYGMSFGGFFMVYFSWCVVTLIYCSAVVVALWFSGMVCIGLWGLCRVLVYLLLLVLIVV